MLALPQPGCLSISVCDPAENPLGTGRLREPSCWGAGVAGTARGPRTIQRHQLAIEASH